MGFWTFLLFVWLAGVACIPHLLLLNKRPTATLAWLWALLLFPFFGPILYLMIGSEQVQRRRLDRRIEFRDKKRWALARAHADKAWKELSRKKPLDNSAHNFLETLSTITQLPGATAHNLQILRKAGPFYASLSEAIRNAKHTIEFQSFIWRDDEIGKQFLDLLVAAAKRGVAVRVLIDELGSVWLRESYFNPLLEAGGQFSWCHTLSPLRGRYSFNLRNHRKLQIIDGTVAYVGGMNFGREYAGLNPQYGDWFDVQLRMEGSVVEILHQIFAEDWFFATGKDDLPQVPKPELAPADASFVQALRGGPDEEDQPMLRTTLALITKAQRRLWIAAGYFVPSEAMLTTLQVAVARGVDVRVLISFRSEHPHLVRAGRSYYDALMRQGIRLYEYTHGIEHSKYYVIDDDWASIGSSNFDERSMRLNFELSLLAYDHKLNHELAAIFEKTISEAVTMDRETFAKRPFREKLIEAALRPLSPVL
jgi:cardiolipin synthase